MRTGGTPTASNSLTVIGTLCSGPQRRLGATAASAARACSRGCSTCHTTTAFIGKGKALAPHEFGYKSLPLRKHGCRWQLRPPNLEAASLCCSPKRCTVIRLMAILGTGDRRARSVARIETRRVHVDKGCRGYNHGHSKTEHRMGRNYLKAATATASTPCSALPATTSLCSWAGRRAFCGLDADATCHPSAKPKTSKDRCSPMLHG